MHQAELPLEAQRGIRSVQMGHLPPIAGGSGDHHDVVCIEAQKLFDFCFQEHRVERTFVNISVPENRRVIVECEIDDENITCREVGQRREVEGKKGKFLVCIAVEVPVVIRIVEEADPDRVVRTIEQTVVFLKQAVLCAPEGTRIQCEVTGNCCCFFDRTNREVTCAFDFCVVISSKATVRILVPTLGFCTPAECRSVTLGCPPKLPKDCDFKDKDKDKDFKDRDFKDRDCC